VSQLSAFISFLVWRELRTTHENFLSANAYLTTFSASINHKAIATQFVPNRQT